MRAFEYRAPVPIQKAMALLAIPKLCTRSLAGGTDLLVQLREGRIALDLLVDIKRLPEINHLTYDPAEGLTLGSAVPCCGIYEDQQIREL